jgi:iron complex outermembrane recepter protein
VAGRRREHPATWAVTYSGPGKLDNDEVRRAHLANPPPPRPLEPIPMPRPTSGLVALPLLSAILLLAVTGVPASAGTPEGLQAAPARADTLPRDPLPGDTIDPIPVPGVVVNILRSPVRMDRAPFAVSVIREEMRDRGRSASSIEEALHGLPGVQVQNRFNAAVGEQISVRGFGARSQFGVRGIRVFVDGIPATLPDGQSSLDHLDLGSLGRVEALRGPGAAMYGNASGGVLNFQTRSPSEAPIRQEIRFVEGDHGMRRLQATTSGTLDERDYLVSFSRYDWDGFRTRIGGSPGDVYGQTFREQVNATFRTPLFGGEMRLVANHLWLDAENPGSLSRADFELGDRRAFPGNVNQRTGKTVRQTQGGVSWSGPLGGRGLELSLYGVRRDLSNPIPAAIVDLDRVAGGIRALLRTDQMGPTGSIWWAVGFEVDVQNDERFNFRNQGGERGDLTLDQEEQVLGGAVFVQALLPINDVLDVMTGLRYDRIRFRADDRFPRGPEDPVGTGARTLDSASPSFGLHASFDRALGVYMNLSTAFETPTTTELANRPDGAGGFNPDLDPQVGITGELGARGLLGDVAAWELSVFHTALHNELVPFEVETAPGRTYFRNSGRSQREGVEAALQFSPDPAVSTRFVVSTNRARFRTYTVGDQDFSGNRVPGVAPWRAEAILRVGPGRWYAELRGESVAAIPANDANDAQAEIPARRLLDARFAIHDVRVLRVELSPFLGVTNVFDRAYVSSVAVNAFGGRFFEPGPGRSLYVGASLAVSR